MPVPSPKKVTTSTIFNTFAGQLLQALLFDVANYRSSGMTDKSIREVMRRDWEAGRGSIAAFQRQAEHQYLATQQKFYMEGQFKGADSGSLYTWHAVGIRSCPSCVVRMGQTRTFGEWARIGLPGAGTTECKFRCRCTLIPLETALKLYDVSDKYELHDKAQAPLDEIRKKLGLNDKDRGKAYAETGDFHNQLSNFRQKDHPTTEVRVKPTGEFDKTRSGEEPARNRQQRESDLRRN